MGNQVKGKGKMGWIQVIVAIIGLLAMVYLAAYGVTRRTAFVEHQVGINTDGIKENKDKIETVQDTIHSMDIRQELMQKDISFIKKAVSE